MKMNSICYSIYNFFPREGGAEKFVRVLARNIRSGGESPLVATLQLNKNWKRKEVVDGMRVYRIPVLRLFGVNKMGKIGKWFYGIGVCIFLLRKAKEYSVFHANGCTFFSFVGVFVSHILKKKVVLTVHGNWDSQELKRISGKRICRRLLYFNRVVSVNRKIFNDLRTMGFDNKKLLRIYNGVDTREYFNEPKETNSPGTKQIIFIGGLRPVKNVDLLIKTISVVRKRRGDIRLTIVGSGPLENDLKALTRKIGGEHYINFAGRQGNVIPFLRSADIFVLPSREEGMSIALLEAMASGLPCVASNVDGNREVIKHGENGLLFEPNKIEDLGQLITIILDHPEYGKNLGKNARKTVEQRFSLETMAKKYVNCYSSLLSCGS